MSDIKYIYFEVRVDSGHMPIPARIQNENALMFKPETNSSGIWGITSITEKHGFSIKSSFAIHQSWIDLEKYEPYTHDGGEFDKNVQEVLKSLNIKLRKPKLDKIKSNI